MSYTSHEWQDGDVITADRLNNLESGAARTNDLETRLDETSGAVSAMEPRLQKAEAVSVENLIIKLDEDDGSLKYSYQQGAWWVVCTREELRGPQSARMQGDVAIAVPLAADADLAAVVTKINALLAALEARGVLRVATV